MRKTFIALSVATALFAGQALADQATADSLQAYGISMTAEQNAAIVNAEGQQLVDAIAQLVAAQPEMAPTIVAATININPNLSDAIVAAAIQAAPGQEQAIRNVVKANKGSALNNGASVPTSSMPSIGGSGGGSTSAASPH